MKERIVTSAWELVSQFHSLKKLNFLPSVFGMTWLFVILIYQISFSLILFFDKTNETIHFLTNELPDKPYFWWLVIGLIVVFIFYTLLNPIARWGMIYMMDTYRKNQWQKYHRSWQWFFDGLSHFLPIFELQNITAIFAPISIITSTIFLIRLIDPSFHNIIWIAMWIYGTLAFLINMCFAYAPFFVIFEKKKSWQALSSSVGMALGNISITARLYFTNILLYFRIVLIGGLFLVMPFLISSALAYFSAEWIKIIFLVIFSIISTIFFIFIAYLNSVLEIFILALWYEAYIACKEEGV